jgi:unspecific monooxygenase
MLDMKATIVGIWGMFRTEIADERGMVANGGYTCEPLGVVDGKDGERRFLRLRLKEVMKG